MTSPIHKILLTTGFIAALGMAATASSFAQDASFSAQQKEEMGQIIRDYILENPGLIIEALEKQRAEEQLAQQRQAEVKIKENISYLTREDAPSIGPKNAEITVVEFFDYNCGYCKRALPDIQNVVKEDEGVRFVFKEMPILGPTSKTAALWALAAHEQGKYFDYHVALMEHKGQKNDEQLEKLAKDTGIDVDQAKKTIASGKLDEELDQVMKVSREIGVSGTPAFVVGTTFIPGYVGEEGLKEAIRQEREKAENDG